MTGGGDSGTVDTHCPYCALNCGLRLETDGQKVVGSTRWRESPLTTGALCSKGTTAFEQVHHGERLTSPLLRRGSDFVEIGWDEALDRCAEGFTRIRDQHGPDANAVLSGGSLTNEKVYLIGKLARLALGTSHIDYNGRFCMTSAGAANTMAFGSDRMMTPLDQLDDADVAVVIGANLSDAFPVMIPKALQRLRERGGRVVVIDPRRGRWVKPDDLVLAPHPGTDAALCNGLLRQVHALGRIDQDFVATRCRDFDEALAAALPWTLEATSTTTDVPAELIAEAAEVIGTADRCMYLHGRGPEQQAWGTNNVLAIINLGLALGHVGRPGCGVNMLTGQRNGQGGREWGQRCNQLPAARSVDDDDDRAVVAAHWGVEADAIPKSGASYVEILQMAGRREVRGLLTICTNMAVSAPDLDAVASQVAALDHHVVVDPFFSESAAMATLVLPGPTFAEESGTITTIEGRVVRIDAATSPVAGLGDHDIIKALAARLGAAEHFDHRDPEAVFDEMRAVSAGSRNDHAGMTYERIRDEGGLFWPCPSLVHPGTPQLYVDRFSHPDGRARFHAVVPAAPPVTVDAEHPLVLTTGRVLAHFLSGNQTMRIEAQQRRTSEPVLEVHPDTAASSGLDPDHHVEIESALGTAQLAWTANEALRSDTVFLPYHWPLCNRLVPAVLDPISRIPAFKYVPVAIRPAQATQTHGMSDTTVALTG